MKYPRLLDAVITKSNVTRLAEIITVRAVKTLANHSYGKLEYLYKNLLIDVYEHHLPAHTFSDGYDLVQECALFLWRHNGQALNTYYGKDKFGKPINILYACYHLIDKYLYQYIKRNTSTCELNQYTYTKHQEIQQYQDYTIYDDIIKKMDLKQGEIDTLNCYMAGMSYCEIARFLNVNFTTVWRRRMRLQEKYLRVTRK